MIAQHSSVSNERIGNNQTTFASFEERFWSKVDFSGGSRACWPWLAFVPRVRVVGHDLPYGRIRIGRSVLLAHRVAYELTHRDLSPGEVIMHSCDNPRCVNPRHLKAGSQQDNVADAIAKGRHVNPRRKRRA